jgi:hypothetical protein
MGPEDMPIPRELGAVTGGEPVPTALQLRELGRAGPAQRSRVFLVMLQVDARHSRRIWRVDIRLRGRGAVATPLLLGALAIGCGGGGAVAPIPRGLEDAVASARASVEGNWEGFPRPGFAFAGARCRLDGGLVIIFLEQGWGARGRFAYAMAGGGAVPGVWAGGTGIDDLATDEEIISFFTEVPEVPCEGSR